jgi:hypothetical protein
MEEPEPAEQQPALACGLVALLVDGPHREALPGGGR